MDLEDRAEVLVRHHRALDVPARSPRPPGRVPRRVLPVLRPLPEREVPRIFLQRVRLLVHHLVRPLARELTVGRRTRDPEVDVAFDGVREIAGDEGLDRVHDLRDSLGCKRLDIGSSQAEIARILDVPRSRVPCELGAAARRGIVDLVVDVRDVLDERHVVSRQLEPAPQPHREHERARVADVDSLVDGRPAEVHANRPGCRRELVFTPCQGVIEPHRSSAGSLHAEARGSRSRARGRARAR